VKDVILGVGNPILSDDRLGLYLVNRMRQEIGTQQITFVCSADAGFDVIEHLYDHDRAIIIDSMHTGQLQPGEYAVYSTSDFKAPLPFSIHSTDLLAALRYARKCTLSVPAQIHLIGVEVADNQTFAEEFSPAIETNKDTIYRKIKKEIINLLKLEGGQPDE